MNKLYLSKNFALLGVFALGAITATNITTFSAQAATIGSLAFEDGTTDFFDQVQLGNNANVFTVDFVSPQLPFDQTFVSTSTGVFNDGNIPDIPVGVQALNFTPQGTFAATGVVIGGIEFEYQLTNDLTWSFSDSGIEYTIEQGSKFLGFDDNGGVEFEFEEGSAFWDIPNIGIASAPTEVMTFGDIALEGGGEYGVVAEAATGVPEPGIVLGLLTVSSLGLGLKRKKQL